MNDISSLFGSDDGFDPMSVEPQADYIPVPPGKYPVRIESACMKKTRAGDGSFLELCCMILDGPAKGRKIWDRLNLDNKSVVAKEIAVRSFAALGRSLKLARVRDSRELVGGQCIACIKVKNDQNEIRTYEPLPVAQGPVPAGVAPPSVLLPPSAAALAVPPVAAPQLAPAPPTAAPAPPVAAPQSVPAPVAPPQVAPVAQAQVVSAPAAPAAPGGVALLETQKAPWER